ncbi:MAG TPA: MFS transporter, partial [Mycobacterium sp.]|nr:MFS transporter [Mycobacterium sp.]
LAGGFATTPAFLLAARAVQGAGGALVAPAALSLITTTFPEGPPRTRAFGVYAAMSIAGGAIGLIGGGLLTTYASWRWVLFVNVPIGAAVALAAPRVLAETPRRRGRFDLPGALTGTAGVTALVYGLISAATSPNGVSHWGDAKVVASLAAAAVLLAAFAVIETRSPQALMPIRLQRAMTYTQSAERVLSTHWAVILDASSQAWTRDVNGLLTQASAVALAQTMRASGQTAHAQATVTTIIDYAS